MGVYDTTIGTLLVGIFFNTFLYGLVTYQFVVYYQTKFNDRPMIKYMVLFLFILDTFHSASVIYIAWYYTVTNYDNPAVLGTGLWPYPLIPISTALAALVTQLYLGHRIWRFTDNKILYGVVIVLAIPSFLFGIVCGIDAWIHTVYSEIPRMTPFVFAWLTMQVVVDTFITITLSIVFHRSRTGFGSTDAVLNRLIRGAIQTGLFAGIFSICTLINFAILPISTLYTMFSIPLGRIYTNTIMDSLLSRESLKADLHHTYDVSAALAQIEWAATESSQASSKVQSSKDIQIQVQGSTQETGGPSTRGNPESKVVQLEV